MDLFKCDLKNKELIERIELHIDDMYKTGRLPVRTIPAKPNNDFDLLVSELIVRYENLLEEKGCA